MKRKRQGQEGREIAGLTCCQLCKAERQGQVYEFWSGFREKLDRTQLFNEVLIRGQYSDLKPFQVFVCDPCVAGLRRRKHLTPFIAWGVLFLPCLVGLAVLPFLGLDRLSGLLCLGVLGLPAAAAGLFWLYRAWQMFGPVSKSPATDRLVLEQIRREKGYTKKGYDLFTQAEYGDLFSR